MDLGRGVHAAKRSPAQGEKHHALIAHGEYKGGSGTHEEDSEGPEQVKFWLNSEEHQCLGASERQECSESHLCQCAQ